MKAVRRTLPALLLLSPILFFGVLPTAGQANPLHSFEVAFPQGVQAIELGRPIDIEIVVADKSRDNGGGLVDGGPSLPIAPHHVDFAVAPGLEDAGGWDVAPPTGFAIYPGQTKSASATVRVDPAASNPYFNLDVTVTIRAEEERFVFNGTVSLFTNGLPGFSLTNKRSIEIEPRELSAATIEVNNANLQPRTFDFAITDNPCGLSVVPPPSRVVQPKTREAIEFTVQGPGDKFWYNSDDCSLGIRATAQETGLDQATSIGVVVNGFYVKAEWKIWGTFLALIAAILFLLIKRRKERLEEEILGKPQKPWLIPVEKVYLDQLKKEDPRAWYTVRHYLMEDEYRSALLWYGSYKEATKGARKKERLILVEEKKYARWKAAWQRAIGRPAKKAERKVARLTRKLQRKAERGHRKALKAHEAEVAKLQAAHAKRGERRMEAWEKQARKAIKKGLPEPPKPPAEQPDLPPAPAPPAVQLEGTRLGRKADRLRKRAARNQGDLEVRFEKADARRKARTDRKVARLARKLDDPEFVREHVRGGERGSASQGR